MAAGSLGFNDDNLIRVSSQENTPPKKQGSEVWASAVAIGNSLTLGLTTHETEKTRTLNLSLHPNHPATELF
jgi:hypothetical protein